MLPPTNELEIYKDYSYQKLFPSGCSDSGYDDDCCVYGFSDVSRFAEITKLELVKSFGTKKMADVGLPTGVYSFGPLLREQVLDEFKDSQGDVIIAVFCVGDDLLALCSFDRTTIEVELLVEVLVFDSVNQVRQDLYQLSTLEVQFVKTLHQYNNVFAETYSCLRSTVEDVMFESHRLVKLFKSEEEQDTLVEIELSVDGFMSWIQHTMDENEFDWVDNFEWNTPSNSVYDPHFFKEGDICTDEISPGCPEVWFGALSE